MEACRSNFGKILGRDLGAYRDDMVVSSKASYRVCIWAHM